MKLATEMGPAVAKKRKVLDGIQGKTAQPSKKFRKQRNYHSSSEDEDEDDEPSEFQGVSLADSDEEDEKPRKTGETLGGNKKTETKKPTKSAEEANGHGDDDDDESENGGSDDGSDASGDEGNASDDDQSVTSNQRTVPKRNDPSAFSTSISKILSTKLPTSARADPVLSRSKTAAQTSTDFSEEKLDRQARAKLKAERKEELDRGRVRDVMGIERGEAGPVAEEEKRLRKTAQRGVVKLFNAVRAAQVRGEEAVRKERKKGTVGIGEREKAANEVSQQGFLELISGKGKKPLNIEEA